MWICFNQNILNSFPIYSSSLYNIVYNSWSNLCNRTFKWLCNIGLLYFLFCNNHCSNCLCHSKISVILFMFRINAVFSLKILMLLWTINKIRFITKNFSYFFPLISKNFYLPLFSLCKLRIFKPVDYCICQIHQMTKWVFWIYFSLRGLILFKKIFF